MNHHNWIPVLIVNLEEGYLSRQYLAKTPDGILGTGWDTPPEERIYPHTRLIGWGYDIPFEFPVRFYRARNPLASYIMNGAWVLPYDEALYQEYLCIF